MADTLDLELVTPERPRVHEQVSEVQAPCKDGYLGILPGHAPLITELAVGEITYRNGGTTHHLSVAWGFAEVLPDKVTILAETAERASEIDVNRAESAKQRAEKDFAQCSTEQEFAKVDADLKRAETRLEVAEKK